MHKKVILQQMTTHISSGHVDLKAQIVVYDDDGSEISRSNHRCVLDPGQSIDTLGDKIVREAAQCCDLLPDHVAMFQTKDKIDKYNEVHGKGGTLSQGIEQKRQ